MKTIIKNPTSKFLKVSCNKCKNEQVIFGKASTKEIKCLVCGEILATSTGGKTNVNVKILEVLG
jgi:small subunit ribosomal protein S27e